MFDIYDDTCLHAGVLADGVAQKLDPENYQELSKLLEDMATFRYRRLPGFRAKLAATHNETDASEEAARAARQWLEDAMTQWAKDILKE